MTAVLLSVAALVSKIGRTQFESKSQHEAQIEILSDGWYQRSEEPSLKANHNSAVRYPPSSKVGIKDRKNPV